MIHRFVMGWYHAFDENGISYLDMCLVIQLMDMLITMICIYVGFVKKDTDTSYCKIYGECCKQIKCCKCLMMSPNDKNKSYTVLWDKDLMNRPINGANGDENIFYTEEIDYEERKRTKYTGCSDIMNTTNTTQSTTGSDTELTSQC